MERQLWLEQKYLKYLKEFQKSKTKKASQMTYHNFNFEKRSTSKMSGFDILQHLKFSLILFRE